MSIKIAVSKELEYKVPAKVAEGNDDVILLYKVPTSRQLMSEVSKYQVNGQIEITQANGVEAMLNFLDNCLVGWKGIIDEKDKKLKFNKEYIQYLPFEIQMDFINNVLVPKWGKNDKTDDKDDKLGN